MAVASHRLRDVAERAGVSVATASKALNDKAQVAPETRRRVREAADALHFMPNALVRSLQQGRTHTVGVCTWAIKSDSVQDITQSLLAGVAAGVASTGLDLLLYSLEPAVRRALTAASFRDGRVDGAILGPTVLSTSSLMGLAETGLPTVVIYRRDVPDSIGSVCIDNAAGVNAAVKHLVALGHRRIAFCGPQTTPDMRERFAAYRQGMKQYQLPWDTQLAVLSDDWHIDPSAACDLLLALPDPPTALLAGDDYIAFGCWKALAARGINVPYDMSILGFDDCTAAAAAGLTTVRQPAEKVGRLAGQFIGNLIGGAPAAKCQSQLPVELIVRTSTAPPKLLRGEYFVNAKKWHLQ